MHNDASCILPKYFARRYDDFVHFYGDNAFHDLLRKSEENRDIRREHGEMQSHVLNGIFSAFAIFVLLWYDIVIG